MAYRIGDNVQALDGVSGQWHTAVLRDLDISNKKAIVSFTDIQRVDQRKTLGYLSAETSEVLSDDKLLELCRRAIDEKGDCIPGPCGIKRGQEHSQHSLNSYLLETFDANSDVSVVVCRRLRGYDIELSGSSFLRLMELVVGELDAIITVKDLIRTPIPVRLLKRSLGHRRISPASCRLLQRGDNIWFEEDHSVTRGTVQVNDQFKCCVRSTDGILVPYEQLQKQPEDSFILQLSETSMSEDDSGADPDWALSRACDASDLDVDDVSLSRKRKRESSKTTSTPMIKKRQKSKRGITLLGFGNPAPRALPMSPTSPLRSPTPPSSPTTPSRSPTTSPRSPTPPPRSPTSTQRSHTSPLRAPSPAQSQTDMRIDIALLRADVNTLMDNQNTILDNQKKILALLSLHGNHEAPQKTKPKDGLTDPRVWDLRPVDLPEVLTDDTVRTSLGKARGDPVLEAKDACGGSRDALAKELFGRLFTLGDIYERNVYGRARGRNLVRKPLKEDIVKNSLSACFQAFPTHGQQAEARSSCVNTLNTYNRYLWNRRLSLINFPALPDKYKY